MWTRRYVRAALRVRSLDVARQTQALRSILFVKPVLCRRLLQLRSSIGPFTFDHFLPSLNFTLLKLRLRLFCDTIVDGLGIQIYCQDLFWSFAAPN
jgi:hypothetical protein